MRRPSATLLSSVLCAAAACASQAPAQSVIPFTISAPSPAAASAGSGAIDISLTVRQNVDFTGLPQFGFCLYTGVSSIAVARSASTTAAKPTFTTPASDFDIPPASFSSGQYTALLNMQVLGAPCAPASTISNTIAFAIAYPTLTSVSLSALPQPNPNVAYTAFPTSVEMNGANFNSGTGANVAFTGGSAFRAGIYLSSVGSVIVPVPAVSETGATSISLSACNTSAQYRYCSAPTSLASFALASTTTQLTSSVASPTVGQATTLTAKITPGPGSNTAGGTYVPGPPGGTVTFTDGSTILGTAPLLAGSLTFASASPQTINASGQVSYRLKANARTRIRPNDNPAPAGTTSFSSILSDFNLDGVKDTLLIDTNSGNFHLLLAGSPTGNFRPEHVIASGCSSLSGATVADLNGDGFPDIAFLCLNADNSTSLFALYNLGDGTFGPATAILSASGAPLLTGGNQIGSGDLNKDGSTDLVVTGPTTAAANPAYGIQTFFGDGAGHFTAGPITPTSADPGTQLIVRDLNNDGALDLVLLNSSTQTYTTVVQPYRNDGSGAFTVSASLPVCDCYTYTAKLVVTPLTANTLYPDLLVTAPDQQQILVALNQRAAALAFAPPITRSIPNLADAVVGDLNGDGLADLVFFDGAGITTLNGDGAGNFATQTSSPNFTATGYSAVNVTLVSATDVNQDGYADLLTLYPGTAFTSTLNAYITTGTAVATLPATFTAATTHQLTTSYLGNTDLLGSSGALSLTVQPAQVYTVSIAITAPPSNNPGTSASQVYTPGGTFSLNFTLIKSNDPFQIHASLSPGGYVTVSENGVPLGTAAIQSFAPNTGSASLINFGSATTGVHALTIAYSGDANFQPSTSAFTFTVQRATPVITWTTPATINTNTPLDNTILSASASVPGTFQYTPSTTYLAAGPQTLTALFTPTDAANYQNVTTLRQLTVLKVDPTTSTLQATPNPQTYLSSNPTILTATIAGLNLAPTGVVQFFDGTIPLGSQSLADTGPNATSAAQLTLASLSAGIHTFKAQYAGDGVYTATTGTLSYTVGPATPILTYTPVPATITYGTSLVATQFDATAVTPAGTSIPGTFTYNHAVGDILMAGTQTLIATFTPTDPTSFQAATARSTITVLQATSTITLALSSGGSPVDTIPAGNVITLTASGPATTGQVNFCDASAAFCTDIHLLGTAQLTSSGTATFRFIPAVGTHTYRAVFLGSTDSAPGTSDPATLTVTGTFPTSTTLTASGTPASYSLVATVIGTGSPLLTPTGTVSFLDASNANSPLATAPLGPATTALTFATHPVSAAGINGNLLATADFNGDGIPDLLAGTSPDANGGSQSLSVYLGKGDGTFTPQSPINLSVRNAITGDFNHDGITDIALSNSAGNAISVLLGQGDGTFTLKATLAIPGGTGTLIAADFNHDGLLDLATGSTSTHTATNPPTYTGTLTVLLGAGDGTFHAMQTSTPAGAASLAAADFNGDGIPDLVAGDFFAQTASIFLGKGDGTFSLKGVNQIPSASAASFTTADFNGDGIADIAALDFYSGVVTILLGQGDGSFAQPTTFSDPTAIGDPNSFNIAAGDFNQDGIPDLAVTADDGVSVYLGAGDGTFTMNTRAVPQTLATEQQDHEDRSLLIADFNSDGLLDIATTSPTLALALNTITATATATANNVVLSGYGPHALTATYSGDPSFTASASAPLPLTGQPVAPVLTFNPTPATLIYGTPLPATLFNATATTPTGAPIAGAVTYNHAAGDILAAGTQTLTATFLPADPLTYTAVSLSRTLLINRAAPTISFPVPPTAIVGTPLSTLQLNPVVSGINGPNLPGTITFTPNTGLVTAGPQSLNVTFTPVDTADYTVATITVTLNGTAVTLAGLSSVTAQLGDPDKTLTLTGTGFASNAVVRANGAPLNTAFLNSTTLTAVLPASNFLVLQTLQISVFNPTQNQASEALPFTIIPAPVGAITFTGPTTANSGDQPTLHFTLTNPYPVDLTAIVTLSFAPISSGVDDPAIQFKNGGRTFRFNLAAGQTTSPSIQFQTGTVAGTIQIALALFITNGGINVTPASLAPILITIPPAAPVITSVAVVRSGRQLTVNTFGLSNTRVISQAAFHFAPASGQQIQTQNITLDVTSLFNGWYSQAVSATYGSTFLYTQTFTLDDDATVVGSVTVTLSNGVGNSASGSSN